MHPSIDNLEYNGYTEAITSQWSVKKESERVQLWQYWDGCNWRWQYAICVDGIAKLLITEGGAHYEFEIACKLID